MGTNYYLKKLPSKERKEELIEAIKKDDVNTIRTLTDNMYNNLIHLGKSSYGWQFDFNPNFKIHFNSKTGDREIVYAFPLTREGIDKFIRQDGYIIVDEYDEDSMTPTITPDEFWKISLRYVTKQQLVMYLTILLQLNISVEICCSFTKNILRPFGTPLKKGIYHK